MFLLRPHTETTLQISFIAIPVVLIFIWLFNSFMTGKIGNARYSTANKKIYLAIIFAFILIAPLVIYILFR